MWINSTTWKGYRQIRLQMFWNQTLWTGTKEVFQEISANLREWASNSPCSKTSKRKKSILGNTWKTEEKHSRTNYQVKLPISTGNDQCQKFSFSDASGKAFGTTIYLKFIKENQVSTSFIFSKSKIASNKELSICWLEQLAVSH